MQESNLDNNLGTEKISKLFKTIVVPSILAMVIMGMQGMIDGIFLGNFVGPNAMASVNISLPFMQISSAIGMIISIGGTAFIGRMLGSGDKETAKTIFKTCFLTLIASGVVILVIGTCFSESLASMLGANEVLIKDTSVYIKTLTLFLPFLLIYYLISMSNRIIGKPMLFLMGTLASILVNIGLNYLLIAKLELGVRGAGFATGLSYIVGFLINIAPSFDRNCDINVFDGKFDFGILMKVAYNGSSEGITSVAMAVTTLVFNLTFMHYYGEDGVSAFTIIGYIAQVANLFIFGLVDGISPIISFNFGAKLYDRVKKVLVISIVINLVIGIFTYLVILLYGKNLIGIFTGDNIELINLTYDGAKLYALMFFICGFNILASSYFTAIGEAGKSVVISSSRGLVFILVGIVLLPNLFGVSGVWLVTPFADLVTLIILIAMLSKYKLNEGDDKYE